MSKLIINKLSLKNNNLQLVNLIEQEENNSIIIDDSTALVGQSVSGKSLILKTILNMTPKEISTIFTYNSDFELNSNNIGFIPQNPFTSLSPMTKISNQFFSSKEKINELLNLVNIEISLKEKFPSQLSGGQLQRIVIAIALSKNPKILLLDEPTTALDVESKNNILNILIELKQKLNFLIIFVSHDIESIKDICKNIIILENGKICESGLTSEILKKPKTQYTKKLIESNFKNREFRI